MRRHYLAMGLGVLTLVVLAYGLAKPHYSVYPKVSPDDAEYFLALAKDGPKELDAEFKPRRLSQRQLVAESTIDGIRRSQAGLLTFTYEGKKSSRGCST